MTAIEGAIVSRKTRQKFRVMLRVRAEFHFYKVIAAESPPQAKQLALGPYTGDVRQRRSEGDGMAAGG